MTQESMDSLLDFYIILCVMQLSVTYFWSHAITHATLIRILDNQTAHPYIAGHNYEPDPKINKLHPGKYPINFGIWRETVPETLSKL